MISMHHLLILHKKMKEKEKEKDKGKDKDKDMKDEDEDEPIYCICRGPEAGFMVFCDKCEDWFHGSCVGLKKKQAEKLEKYICPNCAPSAPDKDKDKGKDEKADKNAQRM